MIGERKMDNENTVKILDQVVEKLWTRYLPETTYKMLSLIGYLEENNIVGEKATKTLLDSSIEVENNIPKVIEEKKHVLSKLGFEYPESRKDDLNLLFDFQLIEKKKNDDNEEVYSYKIPVKGPVEVLKLNEEEINILENIKFEMNHEQAFNMILTLILNNNGTITCSLDHMIKTTRVKLTEVKEVLGYLVNDEKSINIIADKPINKLKKQDKIYITLNQEVFSKKRLIV